ncbi:uncharacterized protein ycf36-like [Zingiber officinale]|uniref:DUF1230 family protein n=1 Tax=Zingiber officinale TaxID=94328 RepID=A0A8J5C888_ZINOF|nr:uncharacterized protein ycf36-like [Zingiber officinale]XP_042448766.1 uncharacterized protein ycf36-like [Zingiber officinale]XP_042448767.1 uncharacterized protein ycf36-like [Zingiber officinale]XP_042448768.1 uncharacterized protein ycf36-like [Zingiber officinale]XP_042448770.1 uncharacterized protein ycf36-like [Zingiber officinale]XP_042448771.1 uncharacterized protein ycf36-like [Zingiber officinale]XP_042448772.1 uncharacterized protein ycf36-like [Zingiber officinale]XP_04244877
MAMAASSFFVFPLDARRNKLLSFRIPSLTRTATNYNKQQPMGRRRPPPISASSSSSFRNGTPPETDCPVPFDQLPVNEYQALSTSFPFSWAAADLRLYSSRLAVTGGLFALLVGLPVSAFGTRSLSDPRCALGAASAGLLAVTLAVLRMYLGWAYVGNRLLSATVEYEETGWYDGQIWVKTPEVLARDRLLGSFSVKPVLSRVKLTLVGLAVSLFVCALIFVNLEYHPASAPGDSGGQARAIPGAYNDESARSFEPDAFCGESDLSQTL